MLRSTVTLSKRERPGEGEGCVMPLPPSNVLRRSSERFPPLSLR
jgi:hypothetical protein